MGMVNGLAAAEPVILLNSETRCSQPIFLCDRRFLNRDQKIAHLVRLEIQQISRAQPFRNHQKLARCDNRIRRHEHDNVVVLKYDRDAFHFAAHHLRDSILRIVFALEPVSVPEGGSSLAGICCATSGLVCKNRSVLNPINNVLNFRFMTEYALRSSK